MRRNPRSLAARHVQVDDLGHLRVRTVSALPSGGSRRPHVVIVPGLGAPAYLTRLVDAIAAEGSTATLLDLPGFGSQRPLAAEPTVDGVAQATARWLDTVPTDPVILLGHSSGAQVVLHAAALTTAPVARVVAARPTFAPGRRTPLRALAAVGPALRQDSPLELRILRNYLRGGRDVLSLFRSALADRPERAIGRVRVPLLLTAGFADTLAPFAWLAELAGAARAAPAVEVVRLPGSHNNPFTHPVDLARLVVRLPGEGRLPELRGPLQRQPARPVRALVARTTRRLTRLAG